MGPRELYTSRAVKCISVLMFSLFSYSWGFFWAFLWTQTSGLQIVAFKKTSFTFDTPFMTDLGNIQNLGGSFDPFADAQKEEAGRSRKDNFDKDSFEKVREMTDLSFLLFSWFSFSLPFSFNSERT